MSQLEVDKVIPQSGTTLTLGDSADTITIPSGATLDATNATVTYPAGSITDAAISSTAAIQQSKISGSPGFRNMIINGDMSIAQRGTSTAGITGSNVFVVDRWRIDEGADSTLTMSQENTSGLPYESGFKKSLKVLVTTADATLTSNQSVQLMQTIEAQNLQYLNFGSSTAKDLVLSFYYKSNVTGVHTLCIDKPDTTRTTCPLEFTVSLADTWQKFTLNINANSVVQSASAVIDNDNGAGFRVMWGLAYGTDYTSGTNGIWEQNGTAAFSTSNQQNIVGTLSNYIEITGVQLEAGTTASDFEFLPVDVNLARCYRYFQKHFKTNSEAILAGFRSTSVVHYPLKFFTTMRTTPSFSVLGLTANNLTDGSNTTVSDATQQNAGTCNDTIWLAGTMTSSAGTVGGTAVVYGANGLEVSSEL
jgi:hypothetical protein